MRMGLVISAALLAVGCSNEELSPVEQARQDEADVAAVNAAQVPPPVPIEPQTLGMPDFEKHDMFGAGCNFAPGKGIAAVALAQPERGFMKIDGEVVRFAPDAGSGELPLGAKGKYTGGAYSFVIDLANEEGKQSGYETVDFPARFVLRNDRDQVVYEATGTAQCGS